MNFAGTSLLDDFFQELPSVHGSAVAKSLKLKVPNLRITRKYKHTHIPAQSKTVRNCYKPCAYVTRKANQTYTNANPCSTNAIIVTVETLMTLVGVSWHMRSDTEQRFVGHA